MKAAVRLIMTTVGLVLIAIAVGAIVLREQAGEFAKGRVARQMSHVLGTDTSVERISISPFERAIVLHRLAVKNPPEFKSGDAIRCEKLSLVPDWRTVFGRSPTVHELRLEGTEIDLRYELGRGSNLGMLSQHAADLAKTNPPGRRLRIERLRSEAAKMRLDSNITPKSPVSFQVAAFEVDNLDDGEGISAAKLSSVVLRSLVLEVITVKGLLRPVVSLLTGEFRVS